MYRIKKLREIALGSKICYDEFQYKFYKKYASDDAVPFLTRYADAFYHSFSSLTPHISGDQLIVGEIFTSLSAEEQKEWDEVYSKFKEDEILHFHCGQDSHMAIDYELLLSLGINGIIKKINTYLESCEDDKIDFYNTCKKCLEAIIIHSENYALHAENLASETSDSKRKQELLNISKICRKVPANPPETFYEALQSVHFVTYCISLNPFRLWHQQFQLGHPDRYLFPYYLNDIKNGTLTNEFAQLLLDCLGIQINMRVPNGLSSGYMVGGRDENGQIVQNELTEMLMQVIDDIKLVYPSVGLCYTSGMDEKFLTKACEILSHGCSHPAIFNDDVITKGLKYYGVSEKESRNYIHSTCVEITPVGASNVWVASPYTNMTQLLLDIMDKEYDNFEALLLELFARLDKIIKINFENQNKDRKTRLKYSINPLLSCFVNDCLKEGCDIERGGARYNWIMPSFVGIANLVDSLYAVKEIVFDKKELSVKAFKEILVSDFEGHEHLRLRILNTIPKYGNDIDDIDKYFKLISDHIVSECKKYRSIFTNSNLIPSVFCWVMHERMGRETGATPDGRCAGFPLGDGSGPCQGREMNGPTSSILSSTKWDHYPFIGGVAVNMKFSKNSLGTDSVKTMTSLVKSYLAGYGFEIQINVTDKETLENAIKNPEQYRDLVVRIGGYSDYFVTLSQEMQKEVILRTTHEI